MMTVVPLLCLVATLCVVTLVPRRDLAAIGLGISALSVLFHPGWGVEQRLGHSLVFDPLTLTLTVSACGAAAAALAVQRQEAKAPVLALGALAALGIGAAAHAAALAPALVLVGHAMILLVRRRGAAAALDVQVAAMACSALLLYGLALAYAQTGKLTTEAVETARMGLATASCLLAGGFGLLVVGWPGGDIDPWSGEVDSALILGGALRLGLVTLLVRLLAAPSPEVQQVLLGLAAVCLVSSFLVKREMAGRVGLARLADVWLLLGLGGEVGRETLVVWMVADVLGTLSLLLASGPGRMVIQSFAVASLAGALPSVGLVARQALYEHSDGVVARVLVLLTALAVLWHGRVVMQRAEEEPQWRWIAATTAAATVILGLASGWWMGWVQLLVR